MQCNKNNNKMDTIEITTTHLALEDTFKKHLEEEQKESYSYSNYYNYNNPTYGYGGSTDYSRDRCDCSFYEWSNINNIPKKFSRGRDFFEFLDKCHIKYTEDNKKAFNTYYTFFAACKKGKAELILTRYKTELYEKLNEYDDDDDEDYDD